MEIVKRITSVYETRNVKKMKFETFHQEPTKYLSVSGSRRGGLQESSRTSGTRIVVKVTKPK